MPCFVQETLPRISIYFVPALCCLITMIAVPMFTLPLSRLTCSINCWYVISKYPERWHIRVRNNRWWYIHHRVFREVQIFRLGWESRKLANKHFIKIRVIVLDLCSKVKIYVLQERKLSGNQRWSTMSRINLRGRHSYAIEQQSLVQQDIHTWLLHLRRIGVPE